MQKSFVPIVFTLSILCFIGCKKEVKEANLTSNIQSNVKSENGSKIRLTSVSNEFGTETFSYNSQGLMSEWDLPGFGYLTKVEYDADGRFAKSLVYIASTFMYTIYFTYEKGRVVKEVWYNGNTTEIFDEVFYTFAADGTMLRSESFVQDYYNVYEYTNDRQLSVWALYVGGVPVARADYTYLGNYKNPFDAIPGLAYAFIFADGVYYANKFYSTSGSYTYYDEVGNVILEEIQDPALTTMEPGPQHYPVTASYHNVTFDYDLHFTFTYENCGSCATGKVGKNPAATGLKAGLNKFLIQNPKRQMKQKAAELRAEVRKFR